MNQKLTPLKTNINPNSLNRKVRKSSRMSISFTVRTISFQCPSLSEVSNVAMKLACSLSANFTAGEEGPWPPSSASGSAPSRSFRYTRGSVGAQVASRRDFCCSTNTLAIGVRRRKRPARARSIREVTLGRASPKPSGRRKSRLPTPPYADICDRFPTPSLQDPYTIPTSSLHQSYILVPIPTFWNIYPIYLGRSTRPSFPTHTATERCRQVSGSG